MNKPLLYIGANTPPLKYAKEFLNSQNLPIALSPTENVTHMLLNIPTFTRAGSPAGCDNLSKLLQELPKSVTVIGGNLNSPIFHGYNTIDLLRNESYLAENAAITADCALRIAYQHFPAVIRDTHTLILGWGRIAKCLTKLLSAVGADVTISARNPNDLAMAHALGYHTLSIHQLSNHLAHFRLLFNTVPAMILPTPLARQCPSDCIKIDLASKPGIEGDDVIIARGLPGKLAPESAGYLIGKTILELLEHKEASS